MQAKNCLRRGIFSCYYSYRTILMLPLIVINSKKSCPFHQLLSKVEYQYFQTYDRCVISRQNFEQGVSVWQYWQYMHLFLKTCRNDRSPCGTSLKKNKDLCSITFFVEGYLSILVIVNLGQDCGPQRYTGHFPKLDSSNMCES